MAGERTTTMTGLLGWLDQRLPVIDFWNKHAGQYYAPKNFNFWYYFGVLSGVVLVNQLVTGIFLTMHYKPSAAEAFSSVEYIMRDVEWGWLIRYMHSTGASFFFIVVYLHMFRALLYGSYQKPRELVWVLGMLIFLALMAEAFMGYVLPWGQMSFWGAQVIVSLFGAIPFIGPDLVQWIQGDFLPSDATINRFFALHVVALPIALLLLVVLHLGALHEVGSNNPDGVDIKKKKDASGKPLDGIPFHPYYTVKDTFGTGVFLILFAFVIFFEPTFGNLFLEYDNFAPADPMVTPLHIKPVWYFTPYYAMLRAIPDKLAGVMVMGAAVTILFLLPWLDRSPVRSIRYRGPLTKLALAIFVVAFVTLGWLGLQAGSETQKLVAQICTAIYFLFFILMPVYTKMDAVKPVPDRVTMHD
ncbi:MAG: cytochrome bc complex cytochrome b subunit [Lysobacterales bacterium]